MIHIKKYTNKLQIISVALSGLIFVSCNALVPEVQLPSNPPQVIMDDQAIKTSARLEAINSEIIYLYIVSATNQSFGNDGSLANNFIMMAKSVASSFGSKVKVVINEMVAYKLYSDPKTKDNIYSVNIAISDYNMNAESRSSSIDFGVEFGKGRGETMGDGNPYRNIDNISRIRLEMTFDTKGMIVAHRSAIIGISEVNKGYYFGMRVNGTGLGVSAYANKKEGVGNSVSKLLHFMYGEILEELTVTKTTNSLDNTSYVPSQVHTENTRQSYSKSRYKRTNNSQVNSNSSDDNSELDDLLEGIR